MEGVGGVEALFVYGGINTVGVRLYFMAFYGIIFASAKRIVYFDFIAETRRGVILRGEWTL